MCPLWLRTLVVLLALPLAAGCGAPRAAVGAAGGAVTADGLSLEVDGSSFRRGQPVPLTLRNASGAPYQGGVLGCAVAERWTGAAWVRAEGDERACIAMLAVVAPGETMETAIPLDVAPGSYRFTHTMGRDDGSPSVSVSTRAFRIGTGRVQ